jgi:phage terminase large subunit GpA-like protein
MGRALAQAFTPPKRRTVADWAVAERFVAAESGSPFPGRWSHDLAPYLVEIMECLSLSNPAREVTVKKGAQLGVTECGLNLIGQIWSETPCGVLVTLPSLDTLKKYRTLKLQPMIDATPALRVKVREQKSRDEDGSTSDLKKFPGGFLSLTTASSSKGLQMITCRVYVAEEISEYPFDVDSRGDPLALGDARLDFWSGREKKFRNSTPGTKGSCRVSQRYEAGDQRCYYVPCPHCGDHQIIRWERIEKEGSDKGKLACVSCGVLIDHHHKRAMIRAGVWLKTFEGAGKPGEIVKPDEVATFRARSSEGRQPSFWMSALYSPIKTWLDMVADFDAAKGDYRKEKKFCQQGLGEEYEEKGEAPAVDRLFDRRQQFEWRKIPRGALYLTGAADVQGNRIEWAVYAWGVGFSRWLIDKGVIEGDPSGVEPWRKLDEVAARRYEDSNGRTWPIDAFGCDSGYLSQKVYAWAMRHAGTGRIFALDGRDGWKLPPLGTPKKIDVAFDGRRLGTVMLWPVGTWDLKSELYRALRNLIDGQDEATGEWKIGTAFFEEHVDRPYLQQMTCEYLKDDHTKDGYQIKTWVKPPGAANEAHDIAVYAAALAHHLADHLSPDDWQTLAAKRHAPLEQVQGDLARLWAPPIEAPEPEAPAPAAAPEAAPESKRADEEDWLGKGSDFLPGRRDWLN